MADQTAATDTASPRQAYQIARQVTAGTVSATAILDETIARIARCDAWLAAFCTLSFDTARAQAHSIDRRIAAGQPVGPLAGVPVAIKDLIPTRGIRTTFGSLLYRDHVPDTDDVIVERLRAADALIVGKTNTSEFGYGPVSHNPVFPPTRNPWNPALSPGGSSAGSAAAVAAGMVPLAIGSDGGGSVRVPAALCGVFGFKPSFGRIPIFPSCRDERMPGVSGWETLEHLGPLATSVRDVRLLMAAVAGADSRDRHSIPCGDCDWLAAPSAVPGRIAYSANLGFALCEPEIDTIARAALSALERAGWQVSPHPLTLPDAQEAFEAIVASETDRPGLRRMADAQNVTLSAALAAVLDRDWSTREIAAAQTLRKRITRLLGEFFLTHDILATPTTTAVAVTLGQNGPTTIAGTPVAPSAWTPLSCQANLSGCPAITVPVGLTRSGLPVGLQLMGRHLDDIRVLDVAETLQGLGLFGSMRPPVHATPQNRSTPVAGGGSGH